MAVRARAVVEAAARNGTLRTLRALDLEYKLLTLWRDDLVRLTDLQELMLGVNYLTRLPVGVSRLGCLRVLDLGNNRLQTLHRTLKNKTTRISSATHAHSKNYSALTLLLLLLVLLLLLLSTLLMDLVARLALRRGETGAGRDWTVDGPDAAGSWSQPADDAAGDVHEAHRPRRPGPWW